MGTECFLYSSFAKAKYCTRLQNIVIKEAFYVKRTCFPYNKIIFAVVIGDKPFGIR